VEGAIVLMLALRVARLLHGVGGTSESRVVVVVVFEAAGASDDGIIVIIGRSQLIRYRSS